MPPYNPGVPPDRGWTATVPPPVFGGPLCFGKVGAVWGGFFVIVTGVSGGTVVFGGFDAVDDVKGSVPVSAMGSRKISPPAAVFDFLPPPELAKTAISTMTTATPMAGSNHFGNPCGAEPGGRA